MTLPSRLLLKAEKLYILNSYGKTKNKVYFREQSNEIERKTSADPVNHTNAFMLKSITLIMKMGNVIENVIEILRKIKQLKSEYSKKLSKEYMILKMISEKQIFQSQSQRSLTRFETE